jgi:hypothetical protein
VPFLLRDAWLVPKEGHRCGLQQKDIYGRTTIRIIFFCVCAGDDGDLFPIEDRTLLLVAGWCHKVVWVVVCGRTFTPRLIISYSAQKEGYCESMNEFQCIAHKYRKGKVYHKSQDE